METFLRPKGTHGSCSAQTFFCFSWLTYQKAKGLKMGHSTIEEFSKSAQQMKRQQRRHMARQTNRDSNSEKLLRASDFPVFGGEEVLGQVWTPENGFEYTPKPPDYASNTVVDERPGQLYHFPSSSGSPESAPFDVSFAPEVRMIDYPTFTTNTSGSDPCSCTTPVQWGFEDTSITRPKPEISGGYQHAIPQTFPSTGLPFPKDSSEHTQMTADAYPTIQTDSPCARLGYDIERLELLFCIYEYNLHSMHPFLRLDSLWTVLLAFSQTSSATDIPNDYGQDPRLAVVLLVLAVAEACEATNGAEVSLPGCALFNLATQVLESSKTANTVCSMQAALLSYFYLGLSHSPNDADDWLWTTAVALRTLLQLYENRLRVTRLIFIAIHLGLMWREGIFCRRIGRFCCLHGTSVRAPKLS